MRVLLVDNGTHYKKKLLALLEEFEVEEIAFDDLKPSVYEDGAFDLIVLTGAYNANSVKYYGDTLYADELELIRKSKTPVIGVCFGAQLIAHAYGARLSFVPGGERIKGLKRIWNVTENRFNFFRYYGGRVWSSQRWRITELPATLQCLCASNEGIEVFKHTKRPVYGLQFHPERRADDNDGAYIFYTIVEELCGYRSPQLSQRENVVQEPSIMSSS